MPILSDSVDIIFGPELLRQAPQPEVSLGRAFVSAAEADAVFAALLAATPWRQERIVVYGRAILQPRLTAWYGDPDARYAYSGLALQPLPWTPLLAELKARVEAASGAQFNSLLMNFYRDGRDCVSWHSDAEPELGREPVIASLSFGAPRRFQLRSRPPLPAARCELALGHGDLLVMRGRTQHDWAHQVPRTARPVGPRINLTFRLVAARIDLA